MEQRCRVPVTSAVSARLSRPQSSMATAQFFLYAGNELDSRRVEALQANRVANVQPELVFGIVRGPVRQSRTVRVARLGEIGPVSSQRIRDLPVQIAPGIVLHAEVVEDINHFREMTRTCSWGRVVAVAIRMRRHVAENIDPRRRLARGGLQPCPCAMAGEVDVTVDVVV